MSRPIKFRQPRMSKGKFVHWHYWGYVDDKEGHFVAPLPPNTGGDNYQATGLCDKQGKEIYEGDILLPDNQVVKFGEFHNSFQEGCGWFTQIENYNKALFQESKGWPWSFYKFKIETTEVIGNCFENPALIEEKS